jgi:FAD/FMN-containing dehydrogenase
MPGTNHHYRRLTAAVSRVKELHAAKIPFRIYHGSTNATRILSFKPAEMLDMSGFNHVLHVDAESRTAVVEPNVPMDKLVKETLRHGLVPPVVMEFPGITVGGGIQGGAGESSSFRYGCFNQICNAYEMILADGQVVRASPRQHADLFYGTAGSFGTLGVIASAELRLIPAKRYVELTYLPVASFEEMVQLTRKVCRDKPDYIDGIMYSRTSGVVMVGQLTDERLGRRARFTRAHDQWFYLHVQTVLRRPLSPDGEPYRESIPLVDYLFRYDRGGFWVGRFAFEMFDVPYTRFRRWLLNPILHTRELYKALQESGASQQHVVQDLALPQDKAAKFMQFAGEELGVYPLWICPLLPDTKSPLQSNNLSTSMVINVGVWGGRIKDRAKFLQVNRAIEKQLLTLGGKKWFYAHSYFTKKEFWKLYSKGWYNTLRKKYHAQTLPTIYDKVTVKETFPVNLKRGVVRVLLRRAKLRIT